MILKPIKTPTQEDVASLVGVLALAILTVIIFVALYVGREIFVPDGTKGAQLVVRAASALTSRYY